MPHPQTILILGHYRHCLSVIRSLSKAGHRMIIDQPVRSYLRYSRYVSGIWNSPDILKEEGKYITELLKFLNEREDISMMLPIGDSQNRILAIHMDSIPSHVKVIMPSPIIVTTCHDKLEMCRLSTRLGVSQMPFAEVSDYQELAQRAREIDFPCVIRPVDQFTKIVNEKVFICDKESKLKEVFSDWPFAKKPVFLQRYAYGPRHNLYFLAEKGEIIKGVEVKIIRTDRLDGTGLAVDSISVPPTDAILDACKKFLKYFNYTGLGCAQFLVDQSGQPQCFLEINPRLGAAFALTYVCGVDFPKMAIDQFLEQLREPVANKTEYKIGIRFGWLYGDIYGLYDVWRNSGAREKTLWFARLCNTFLRARSHPTWCMKDPLPTLVLYTLSLLNLIAKQGRSFVKRH